MLEKIYSLLKAGEMIRIKNCDIIAKGDLLYWWRFGQSANKFDKAGLKFILKKIAKYDGEAFINESRSHYATTPILKKI